MRTYYFSTDNAKDMESWMKVMTDAALVHTEPITRWVHHGRQWRSLSERLGVQNITQGHCVWGFTAIFH